MLIAIARPLANPPLYVSWAQVDITPKAALPLGGYTERGDKLSKPGGDHLFARVILLRQGGVVTAIESVETLTIPQSLTEAVQARISRKINLLLCATHTHCAPDSEMLDRKMTFKIPGIAIFKPYWLGWYADRIADAIDKAAAGPFHRVASVVDETWQADCSRGRRKFAKPDQTAHLIHFKFAGGEKNLFWYTAHGTFYDSNEMQTREDWPGGVSKVGFELIQGALGDVSPMAPGNESGSPKSKIANFWKTMLTARQKSKESTVWQPGLGRLQFEEVPVNLGKPTPNPHFAKTYKIPDAFASILVGMFAPRTASLDVAALGRLCLVGVCGEPSSEIGRQIEAAARSKGFPDSLAIAHCGNWIGYLLTPDDYDRGGYEADLNFYGRDSGEMTVDAARRISLRGQAHQPSRPS